MHEADRPGGPVVDVVVPVYNEEHDVERSIRRLRAFLDAGFPFTTRVTIADNASTDGTRAIGRRLATELAGVRLIHLPRKGRGRALRAAWLVSDAQVVAYMDVDLSTDLKALLPLVAALISGHSDLAVGSRLAPGATVVRGVRREVISRCYNRLLRLTLRLRVRDAQCGFKAMRSDVARRLLPQVVDDGWFFDTELLVLAQRAGLRTLEVPVDWVDDPDSRVALVPTVAADLRGIGRLLRHRHARGAMRSPFAGQVGRFAVIGVVSTVAYLGLYEILRSGLAAQPANALALLATTLGNTVANRRLTFGMHARGGA